MLVTIQIIAIIQGLFLLIVLVKNRFNYLKPTLYLLAGSIISIILYILGDDETNFINPNIDVFLFDKSLFITFLFLFVKYYLSKADTFIRRDYLFFLPNILFFIIELLEIIYSEGIALIDIPEILIELIFLSYIIFTIINILKNKSQTWMLFFIIPLVILIGFSIIDEILYWFHIDNTIFSKTDEHMGEYTITIVAFLFYTIALKLIISPKDILIKQKQTKYKNSSLSLHQIETLINELVALMEKDELYKEPNLSIQKIAETLNVPRQYISEILNGHMETNFQAFINTYRVEAFINCLKLQEYNHYTLEGIAKCVGFNSKTSFNSAFKKIKKVTPSEYKNSIKSTN
jgi:AraC-like DNA-binding protein